MKNANIFVDVDLTLVDASGKLLHGASAVNQLHQCKIVLLPPFTLFTVKRIPRVLMKIRYSLALLLILAIAGCEASKPTDPPKSTVTTIRRGRDFDTSKVKEIQKGKTTTPEIIQWFGQPYARKVVSTNQVGWLYAWRNSTMTVNRSKTNTKGKETGYKKRLELLIGDDVVMNYTFEEGPFEADGNRDVK